MATKQQVLEAAARGEGCLGKAAPDEPVFVLRAQDILAVRAIAWWRDELHKRRGETQKVKDVDALLDEFDNWRSKNGMKVKVPD